MRFGVLGAARIAPAALIRPAAVIDGVEIAAVAARDRRRAEAFAARHGIGTVHDSYAGLVADPSLDSVYIPLPNGLHAEWTIRALRAGVPVLCEKPLTGSVADTEQVLGVARETGTPLWEAFAFPFHDQMKRVAALLADGVIGDLREIQSSFHFILAHREGNIRMSPALAGGALNDVGCYPVRLARDLFAAEHTSAMCPVIVNV